MNEIRYSKVLVVLCCLALHIATLSAQNDSVRFFNEVDTSFCKVHVGQDVRVGYYSTGEIYDIIAGNFLITGLGEESFSDLPPDLLEKYKEQFMAPESFARIGGKILAVKQLVPSPEDKERTQKPPHKSGPEL